MALSFPANPTNGQVYTDTVTGNRYLFNSTANVWSYAANNVGMSVSSTPPSNVAAGSMWYNKEIGRTFVYYDDGDSKQWVETVPATGTFDTSTVASYANVAAVLAVAPAYDTANSGYAVANSALMHGFTYGNSSYTVANAAFGKANSGYVSSNAGYAVANAAFGVANTALQNTSGTFAGNLTVTGNFSVSSNNLTIASNNVTPFTMKNYIFNGDMRIDQRNAGASAAVVPGTSTYRLDRWAVRDFNVSGSGTITTQRVAGDSYSQYAQRLLKSSGTSTTSLGIIQSLETINSIPLAGKYVTLSFRARKGSSFTGSSTPFVGIYSGTGTDQTPESMVNSLWTGSVIFSGGASGSALTTSFQTYTLTTSAILPTNTTQVGISITTGQFSSAAGDSNNYLDITDVQLEVGTVATPFERRPYGMELALCQRYFCKTYNIETALGTATVTGWVGGQNGTNGVSNISWFFPVRMRASPTMTYQANGTGGLWYDSGGGYIMTPSTQRIGEQGVLIRVTGGNSNAECAGHAFASIEL